MASHLTSEQLSQIKTQMWEHLQELTGQIEGLQNEGHLLGVNNPREWERMPWGDKRNRYWLADQYVFCRSEIEYWKRIKSEFNKKGEK